MSCLKMFDSFYEGSGVGVEASTLRKVSEQAQSLGELGSSSVAIAGDDSLGARRHFGAVSFGRQIDVLLQRGLDTAVASVWRLDLIEDRLNVSRGRKLLRNKLWEVVFFRLHVDAKLQVFGIYSADPQIRDVPHRSQRQ